MSDLSSPTLGIDALARYQQDSARYALGPTEAWMDTSADAINELAPLPQSSAVLTISSTSAPSLLPSPALLSPLCLPMGTTHASCIDTWYGHGMPSYRLHHPHSPGHPLQGELLCPNAPRTCSLVAIQTLRTIRGLPDASTSPVCIHNELFGTAGPVPVPAPVPVGALFVAHRNAVSSALAMLSCSCSTLPTLRILVGAICEAVVAGSAAILDDITGGVSPQTVRIGSFSSSPSSYSSSFHSFPHSAAACHSDGLLTRRIYACVVLENLEALRGGISRLAGHAKAGGQSSLYCGGDGAALEMDAAVGQYLDAVVWESLRGGVERARRVL